MSGTRIKSMSMFRFPFPAILPLKKLIFTCQTLFSESPVSKKIKPKLLIWHRKSIATLPKTSLSSPMDSCTPLSKKQPLIHSGHNSLWRAFLWKSCEIDVRKVRAARKSTPKRSNRTKAKFESTMSKRPHANSCDLRERRGRSSSIRSELRKSRPSIVSFPMSTKKQEHSRRKIRKQRNRSCKEAKMYGKRKSS